MTHCTHCSLDFCLVPPQVHVEPHLQVPPQVLQSENGHALAIASLTCSIVMEPQPQPAPHSHCFPVAAQEQSAHLSQKKLIAGGVAMLAAMVTGWVQKGAGEKNGYVSWREVERREEGGGVVRGTQKGRGTRLTVTKSQVRRAWVRWV